MIQFLRRVLDFVRAHKVALGVGGGAVIAAGATAALAKRARAAVVGERVVEKIKSVLDVPYIWGGRDPAKGFDCSGVVVWALRELGLEPKRWSANATEMYRQASTVIAPQVGDLVFYGPVGNVDHVMVYMGDGHVIGASGGGPKTLTVQDAKDRNAKVKILPVNYRSDLRGYGRLPTQPASDVVGTLHMLGC